MSASRAPRFMTPSVGLAVRIDSAGDACDGLIGWITDVRGRIARVDFGRSDRIARWFAFDEFVDERIAQLEQVTRVATMFTVREIPFELSFNTLDALERTTCLRSPAPRT